VASVWDPLNSKALRKLGSHEQPLPISSSVPWLNSIAGYPTAQSSVKVRFSSIRRSSSHTCCAGATVCTDEPPPWPTVSITSVPTHDRRLVGMESMWIFGYGSLMFDGWESGYGCVRREWASLSGYRRVFGKKSVKNARPPNPLAWSPRSAKDCSKRAMPNPTM
jgi:hypothetical protein